MAVADDANGGGDGKHGGGDSDGTSSSEVDGS